MVRSNFHTHTTFSDGKSTPEEVVLRAKELSFTTLGFSDHSERMIESVLNNKKSDLSSYRQKIRELSSQYEEEIEILCGVEEDSMAEIDPSLFDYVIGSVHFISAFDELVPIDLFAHQQLSFIEKHGRGDKMELAKRYYDRLVTFSQTGEFNILGHFDLVNKFSLFDEEDPVYQSIALEALEEVVKSVPLIEINTGAIARGYREKPYPAGFLLKKLKEMEAKVIVSSDSHHKENLDFYFDKVPDILKEAGFTSRFEITKNGLKEIVLD